MKPNKYSPSPVAAPRDLTNYPAVTAFINGVNDVHNKIAMREGINRLAEQRGEPYKQIGESTSAYLHRILGIKEPE